MWTGWLVAGRGYWHKKNQRFRQGCGSVGFKRSQYLEPLPPPPPEGFVREVVEAVRAEDDGDALLGVLSRILDDAGFPEEAIKCLRYPPVQLYDRTENPFRKGSS